MVPIVKFEVIFFTVLNLSLSFTHQLGYVVNPLCYPPVEMADLSLLLLTLFKQTTSVHSLGVLAVSRLLKVCQVKQPDDSWKVIPKLISLVKRTLMKLLKLVDRGMVCKFT